MRVVVTGTPGTGKTTATEALDDGDLAAESDAGVDTDSTVVHLNDEIRERDLWTERDEARDSLVADLDAVREWLGDEPVGADGPIQVVESHLAHYLSADRVVVLRCRPDELERRLRDRGETEAKARENAESEALDVILSEAVESHGEDRVYEIDTTDREPEAVAADVRAVLDGTRDPSAGTVNFVDYL